MELIKVTSQEQEGRHTNAAVIKVNTAENGAARACHPANDPCPPTQPCLPLNPHSPCNPDIVPCNPEVCGPYTFP